MIPSSPLASFSHSGARLLQCPHQGAKKLGTKIENKILEK
jgi:hypothetical protein